MVNFGQLVESVLLNEAVVGVPKWFQDVLNKHKTLFGPEITDEDLTDFFDLLDDPVVSDQKGLGLLPKIRILDFMKSLYDNMDPKPEDLNAFKTALTPLKGVADSLNVNGLNQQNKNNWVIKNQNVIDLKQKAEVLADKQSNSAFSTYVNDSILGAIQKIINKRMNMFDRLTNLKSPTQPFKNLVLDIFKTPELYLSGSKKYSSDFEAVDKLYIQDIITIAIAAKEFFAAEISRLKMAPPLKDGFNPFEDLVNYVLINELNFGKFIPKSASDWERYFLTNPETKERFQKMKKTLKQDQANYLNFISGKPIRYKKVNPNTGFVLEPEQILETDPSQYTLGNINNLKTQESKNLINSIKKISEYVRSKEGAGKKLQQLTQTATAIGKFAGL